MLTETISITLPTGRVVITCPFCEAKFQWQAGGTLEWSSKMGLVVREAEEDVALYHNCMAGVLTPAVLEGGSDHG